MSVTVRVAPRLALPAALVAVLAVAAVVLAAAGAWAAWGGARYRVDGPAPATVSVAGEELALVHQQPVIAVDTSASDPAVLLVTAAPDELDDCAVTTVRVLAQDADVVRIAAYGYRATTAGDDDEDGGCPPAASGGPVRVDLGTPLAGRRVAEVGTGHVLVPGTRG